MGHKYPELCYIGSLGLYLLNRFEVTEDIEYTNFSHDKTWFNRKLLKSMVKRGNNKGETRVSTVYLVHFISY